MAIRFTFQSDATLAGARDLNRIHRVAAQDDLSYKIERLISAVNDLNTGVSAINAAISAAVAADAVSALSFAATPTLAQLSNFRA